MGARLAGTGTPKFPPREYPDSPDPDVRFAHVSSPTARQFMAQLIPHTTTEDEEPTVASTPFPIATDMKDAELGRREPKYARALAQQFIDDADPREVKAREYVRSSDAMKCSRQLGYIACGAEGEPMDDNGWVATSMGNYLHGVWQAGMAAWFEAMRADYQAEHGDDAVPGPGVPWRVAIEEWFDESITLPDGTEVPVHGFADLVVYDCEDNALEVVDGKSVGGFAFKKKFKEGVDSGPWIQTWSYGHLKGAPTVSVLNIGKESISAGAAAGMRNVSDTERFATEFEKPTAELDEAGFKEFRRMWGINRLVHEKGLLPRRTIPEYGAGSEIIAPGTGQFENGETFWGCPSYCAWKVQCISDGPGRVPIPETSVLAIQIRERSVAVTEAFESA